MTSTVSFSGDIDAKTLGEGQCPIHFAAKYNAVGSLKVMIENKKFPI